MRKPNPLRRAKLMATFRSMRRWLQEARSKGLHYAVAILILAVLIAWGKVMER